MFEVIAPIYNRAMRAAEETYRRSAHILSPSDGDIVLDVGGGTGFVSLAVSQVASCRVITIDRSRAMLSRPAGDGRVLRVQADAEEMPVATACANRAIILDALHHFRSPEKALREVKRALKPGGHLVIVELDASSLPVRVVAWAERLLGEPGLLWTQSELRELVTAGGLTPVDVQTDGPRVYLTAAAPGQADP